MHSLYGLSFKLTHLATFIQWLTLGSISSLPEEWAIDVLFYFNMFLRFLYSHFTIMYISVHNKTLQSVLQINEYEETQGYIKTN